MDTLLNILNRRQLGALFQPIVDFADGTFVGYEGLIRGPHDSTLHAPSRLFAAARQQQLSLETEMLSLRVVLESFAEQDLPGKLFINVSPDTLLHPSFRDAQTPACFEYLGIDPHCVVIEITENQPIRDFRAMGNAIMHYRGIGFQIAIDDLGGGYSSLRLWSELLPDYVKIDQQFVRNVHVDPAKQKFLHSIQKIAQRSDTLVIAEGIETLDEFEYVRDCGIACGQGYFIDHPVRTPPLYAAARISRIATANRPAPFHHDGVRNVVSPLPHSTVYY